jgi:hypothetical protein
MAAWLSGTGSGFAGLSHPSGARAGSARSMTRLRSESAASAVAYGSVTRLVTTSCAAGAQTVTW